MKSYLRYEPRKAFGVITSPQCNVTYDCSGNLAITGALQEICLWNLRQASQVCDEIRKGIV
jgi:U3 small nucleolar RNA-associated protein 12